MAGRGALSASRPPQSGSNICNGTRPLGSRSPPAAIADLAGCGEAKERARWEGSGSARALRGRAFPTRFQTVLSKEGRRVGVRGLFPKPRDESLPLHTFPTLTFPSRAAFIHTLNPDASPPSRLDAVSAPLPPARPSPPPAQPFGRPPPGVREAKIWGQRLLLPIRSLSMVRSVDNASVYREANF